MMTQDKTFTLFREGREEKAERPRLIEEDSLAQGGGGRCYVTRQERTESQQRASGSERRREVCRTEGLVEGEGGGDFL